MKNYKPKGRLAAKEYIDGVLKPHIKVNYALRGLEVPKGKHIIEFKFEPEVVKSGSTIALASSILLGLLVLGGLIYGVKSMNKISEE